MRGRSERPLRSVSASEMEEDEEMEEMWLRPLSLGWGKVGTGEDPCKSDVDAMMFKGRWRCGRIQAGPVVRSGDGVL